MSDDMSPPYYRVLGNVYFEYVWGVGKHLGNYLGIEFDCLIDAYLWNYKTMHVYV